ncbi:MAG: 4Fe-4S dicluster domain-containing protein, partial [Saprospiraceae bacterium]|nr:4Fe-4S dicluster domain-containing protein [Saprospiraceae bacterium]
QGVDKDVNDLVADMNAGRVDALIVWGANPAYDLPNAAEFIAGLDNVQTSISMNSVGDETSSLCSWQAPASHNLESWGDVEAKAGQYALVQPTISPLFDTRQAEASILVWSGSSNYNMEADQPMYDYLKKGWEANQFAAQSEFSNFQSFWDNTLHNGVLEIEQSSDIPPFNDQVPALASKINQPANSDLEIDFYESVNIGDGSYAHNPWLQEMSDPVSRCVWANNVSVPVKWNGKNDFDGYNGIGKNTAKGRAEVVRIDIGGVSEEFTGITQFGQTEGTASIAIGYGRNKGGKTGIGVGKNVYPWLTLRDADGNVQYFASSASMSEVLGEDPNFACVQYHHTYGVTGTKTGSDEVINVDEAALGLGGYQGSLTDRSVMYQTNLKDLETFKTDLKDKRKFFQKLNEHTLYPYEEYKEEFYDQGHHWEMYVDLNACIGCGACTIACMAENNVPVVGKKEVNRHHEMSWLRIDRYYYGDADNPNVVYQPMMCQHCDNAPCENVCPVAATNHSAEGLNQMTYNRCIGTRYCANNCPYKVRRFNWYDYTSADLFAQNEIPVNKGIVGGEDHLYMTDNLTRMVLNPDVTVRARGVIEKCSFCVQRIQEGKLTAKQESRKLRDSDVKTACQTSCPTGAIVFGDSNNKKGALSKALDNDLVYKVLEEVNTQSSVNYSAKVINRDESLDA